MLLIIVRASVYCVEVEVGVEPSIVYRIVVSCVEQDNVIVGKLVKVPPLGEIIGVATFGVGLIVKLADATSLSV